MKHYFADYFEVSQSKLRKHGAFNISLLTDLPLFIDPFLLFNSQRRQYRQLHDEIIKYLRFLRDKSVGQRVLPGLLRSWFFFSEVKENWLGFSRSGNVGRGLGENFAGALHDNLRIIFSDFGSEKITQGSHLEKLCLVREGVGRDMISDFTTNLIKDFLLRYTEEFTKKHIARGFKRRIRVRRARFKYQTEAWEERTYTLPIANGKYVILTPRSLLTKDDTWINRHDLIADFADIPSAIPDSQLRAEIDNYFKSILARKHKKEDEEKAKAKVYLKFPQLIDYYIKYKEAHGDEAKITSADRVQRSDQLYVRQFGQLAEMLDANTEFYKVNGTSEEEVRQRLVFLKDVIENKGGHRIFYLEGKPISNEEDLHILYRLTWFGSASTVTREANDGRGPVDFKVSRDASDITIVEMKLASNSQLKRNLERQTAIYKKASNAKGVFKVILFFTEAEEKRLAKIIKDLHMQNDCRIVTIDARKDNKPSGSRA